MVFEMVRNVSIVTGCILAVPVLVGFVIGLAQGIRSERRPNLRVFVGETNR